LPPLSCCGRATIDTIEGLTSDCPAPYLSEMRRGTNFSSPYALRALFSPLLVLCLLAAPLCSARCAAQACALPNPSGTSAACHESSDNSDQSGWNTLTQKSKCANNEILFTETRPDNLLTFSSHFSAVPHTAQSFVSSPTNVVHASENVGEQTVPHPAALSSVVPLRL
jgi:hypothetical protein